MNTLIKLEHLSKRFGDLEVLKDINIDISPGETFALVSYMCNRPFRKWQKHYAALHKSA